MKTVRQPYPFTAIVAQDSMKQALLLASVSPAIGGVVVVGQKGTAKSTAVRSLPTLLPSIEVVSGCAYGCDPTDQTSLCPECLQRTQSGEELPAEERPVRVAELPVSATEDRVVGTLDVSHALKTGEKRFEPGLLAAANRGILYVDEVNLLEDHLVDVLLDAAASGVARVEREGVSFTHPARFVLVGTMNPEEGDLRPQLLDRFGLCAVVRDTSEPTERAEIVRRSLDYESSVDDFIDRWAESEFELRERIVAAQAVLPEVDVSDQIIELITTICLQAKVAGHRADVVMALAAAAAAALEGRDSAEAPDVLAVAPLVLAHRASPGHNLATEGDALTQLVEAVGQAAQPSSRQPAERTSTTGSAHIRPTVTRARALAGRSADGAVAEPVDLPQTPRLIRDASAGPKARPGQRFRSRTDGARGRYTSSRPADRPGPDIALDASIRAAAPYQNGHPKTVTEQGNRSDRAVAEGSLAVAIAPEHVRRKVRRTKAGASILFCVDASGSMEAGKRMAAAKGAILALLTDAYQRRDRVGLVSFRQAHAEVVLPLTSDVRRARAALTDLASGGRTPLAQGIEAARQSFSQEKRARPQSEPWLVLVTDGHGNVAHLGREPLAAALDAIKRLAGDGVRLLVIDTDQCFPTLNLARRLANAGGGSYVRLEDLEGKRLAAEVRTKVAR